MKKLLLVMTAITIFMGANTASAKECCQTRKMTDCPTKQEKCCPREKTPTCTEKYEKYCPQTTQTCPTKHSECFVKREYQKMKSALKFTNSQSCKADAIYDRFEGEIKSRKDCIKREQKRLCKMIDQNACKSNIREQKRILKESKKELKQVLKEYKKELDCVVNKCQKSQYRKWVRAEKRKVKQLVKYCNCNFYLCCECEWE